MKTVLCGSFHHQISQLRFVYEALVSETCLLSPVSLDFESFGDEFVRLKEEKDLEVKTIEESHLDAIRRCDAVWIRSVDGYVGLSTAMEIGFANALKKPIYSDKALSDITLSKFVNITDFREFLKM